MLQQGAWNAHRRSNMFRAKLNRGSVSIPWPALSSLRLPPTDVRHKEAARTLDASISLPSPFEMPPHDNPSDACPFPVCPRMPVEIAAVI